MDVSHRLQWLRHRPWRSRPNRRHFNKISSGFPSVMSVALPSSPGGPNGIIRSQSFAGFSAQQERRSRSHSFIANNGALRKPQGKLKKMNASSYKNNCTPKDVEPKRMEEVYKSLKIGLTEYLEVHNAELDKLTTQLKDMKHNSRLGVIYELDKQIKAIERYVRRLEFHISKVDELYETFCIQKRLRDGASKLKQAFEMSPSTKGARESLAAIQKSYKENTEALCSLEGEIGSLLGEFHIKMKGLAGFARLCPGDQYEIFMRYGRQRWKLKGKIEVNDRQSWDGEEMVFLPLINEFFSIKVSELKGLATHLLIGSVICETKDLFTARPQMVAVDINDLGTVKLNLEVTWYPFDKEDLTPSTGNLHKASSVQRRCSIYSQNTPETPTFEDFSFFKCLQPSPDRLRLSFIDALRDTFFDKLRRSRSFSDLPSLRLRPRERLELYSSQLEDDIFDNENSTSESVSFSHGYLANGTCISQPSLTPASRVYSNPEITVTPPDIQDKDSESQIPVAEANDISISESETERTGHTNALQSDQGEEVTDIGDLSPVQVGCRQQGSSQETNIFLESKDTMGILQDSDELPDLKPVELDAYEGNLTKQLVKRLTSTERLLTPGGQECDAFLSNEYEGTRSVSEMSLEEALQGLLLSLEPHKEQYKELQDLDQEVMRLEDLLKCKPNTNRSRSSSLSLTVESALESFDFLNTSDFDEDDGGDHDANSECSDIEAQKTICSEHPDARGHLSEALTEDTGVGTSVAGSPLPLTTGNENLDLTIVKHLQHSEKLFQQLLSFEEWPVIRDSLLAKISQQTRVLEHLAELSTEKPGNINPALEVIPQLKKNQALLSSWLESSSSGNTFYAPMDRLIKQMSFHFGKNVNETCPGHSETVFRTIVNQMLDKSELFTAPDAQEVITVCQFVNYLSSHNISDFGEHLTQLANEVELQQTLQSLQPEKTLETLEEQPAQNLQPLEETLKAIAFLLLEMNNDLVQAATSFLTTASTNNNFREKALLYYTKALTQPNVKIQRAACTALKCIKACESIDILVSLCQSERELLRQAAAESLLSLGEEGCLAYEQLDKVPQDMVQLAGRRGNAVSTAF
ncbi:rho family-interacting cell polarization regulator 2 isoform X2 [Chiloscyllium plagiosum]|uniref:rho family-interacting cell polarization regulator 2 isoform X2 n=1 Tax=Chiloscyllium plagiosum TaxID=36176 RepID=UPI001CB7D8FE|nr:rho family-interacting cell polarization regulator 2 isoform X2 [Chiloscyllium plagiosum]